jgi:hypothetical protein
MEICPGYNSQKINFSYKKNNNKLLQEIFSQDIPKAPGDCTCVCIDLTHNEPLPNKTGEWFSFGSLKNQRFISASLIPSNNK